MGQKNKKPSHEGSVLASDHRCPLPLTSPDPQLTCLLFVQPHSLSVCARSHSFDLACLRFAPSFDLVCARFVPDHPCLRVLLPFPLRKHAPSRWPLVRVCPPCARLFCLYHLTSGCKSKISIFRESCTYLLYSRLKIPMKQTNS